MKQSWKSTIMGLGVLAPTLATAQVTSAVDAQHFKPAIGEGLFGVDSAQILGDLKLHFGAFLNYASNPLVVFDEQNGDPILIPVKHQSALDIMLAVGIKNIAEVGIGIPAGLFIAGDDLALIGGSGTVQSGKLGDVRLNAKLKLVGDPEKPEEDGARVAFNIEAKLPTGEQLTQAGTESFFGDQSVGIAGLILADYKTGKINLSANAGFRFRPDDTQTIENITVGSEIPFGAGLSYSVSDALLVGGEVDAVAQISGDSFGSTPAELRLGAKLGVSKFWIPIGAGIGLNNSFASPDFRIFAGLTFTGQDLDPDKDQIIGPLDKCPEQAEDKDNFEDADGCPELDNDKDLIADAQDECDNDAEDKDGFEDENGCPENDNDKDGVLDASDGPDGSCKNDAEDKDNFQDEDGCPDPDNDQDSIADKDDACPLKKGTAEFKGCVDTDGDKLVDEQDKCPNEAEDFDKFEDSDGCPEADNDKDGIADATDLCPNEPENKNGEKDDDGCPDEVKAVLSGGKVVILDKIFFDTNKTTIKAVSNPTLDGVAKVLVDNPQIKVRIEGNTDDVGDEKKNLTLSEGRAKAVAEYLAKKGVDASRMQSKGNGESVPLVPVTGLDPKKQKKELTEARDQNRRVEFFVID